VDDLPHSLDLAPSNFHLFLHMKRFLASKKFNSDELKDSVQKWLAFQVATVLQ
jgi:hypothetical protein